VVTVLLIVRLVELIWGTYFIAPHSIDLHVQL
jgi:hypothetical protein